jgi:hypothetical protein
MQLQNNAICRRSVETEAVAAEVGGLNCLFVLVAMRCDAMPCDETRRDE